MSKKNNSSLVVEQKRQRTQKRLSKAAMFVSTLLVACLTVTIFAFADFDPETGINTLVDIVKGVVTGVGIIITIFGAVQFGTSFPSHDASQRAMGGLAMAGGLIVAGAPHIVDKIVNG